MRLIHKLLQTWVATLPNYVVIDFATLGPIGKKLKAPGTWGSFLGIFGYSVFFHPVAPFSIAYLFLLAIFTWAAILICGEAADRMKKKDPPEVILDEFVAIPYCFIGLTPTMATLPDTMFTLLGFALFRFFDIVKPLGIKKLQKIAGGTGIVIDDIVAGLYTCVCLHVYALIV